MRLSCEGHVDIPYEFGSIGCHDRSEYNHAFYPFLEVLFNCKLLEPFKLTCNFKSASTI
jgi:hypothetical protein